MMVAVVLCEGMTSPWCWLISAWVTRYLEVLADPDAVAEADWTVGACVAGCTDADVGLGLGTCGDGCVVDCTGA